MKKQGFMRNKSLLTLEKESILHPPLKVQTASVSSQTDELTPQTIFNKNELILRLSSNADSRYLSLDDSIPEKDHQVDEISVCISHLSLDLKNEEESNYRSNVLHPGCEDQRVKNKHKNRRKRSLKHDDCILKDINGALKHYNSLCSTYLFKTRNSNLFVKNECKGNSDSSRSNIQKIANGVKTCFFQSYSISQPGKIPFTPSVLIEEETYLPPNERRNLPYLKSKIIDEPNGSLSFAKPGIQHPRIKNVQREIVGRLIEEDPMVKQIAPLVRNTASSRTRKKKRSVKNLKALLSYRSEKDESYSTEDTDTEDTPRNGLSFQKVQNRKKSFEFAKNRTGWVSSDIEDCLEQQHNNNSEENNSTDSYIRPSSFTSRDDGNNHLPLNNTVIRQQHNERCVEGQVKEDGLIEKDIPKKRNRSSARKTSPLKAKRRKKIIRKIPKAPQLRTSERRDYTDDTDTEGSPQKKISLQKLQNQSLNNDKRTPKMSRNESSADDIEQDYIYHDEEMLNTTELHSSESSLFNFISENYNLQFPKCSSFVLIMGNQLGKHSGISSSMETLCSTNERGPLAETSRNEIFQELSQKMEGFSLSDQTDQDGNTFPSRMEQGEESVQDSQEANSSPTNDFRSDHGNQVAVEEDGNSVKSDQVFNFSVGDLRLDFTPSNQLKARKIVFKKNRNVRRLLFRSNKGALYLKTII